MIEINLPASSGAYVLHLEVVQPESISIGRLGWQSLPAGHYFYMGSACGAGGLRARVNRHLRGGGNRHWHIDYLRAVAEVQDVFYTVADRRLECVWSQSLIQFPRAFIPVPHFGSSDCRSGCAAHLVALPRHLRLASVLEKLSAASNTQLVHLCRR
jgi:Uri superfamily endonuclease